MTKNTKSKMKDNSLESVKSNLEIHAIYLHKTNSQFYNDFDPLVDLDDISTSQNRMKSIAVQVKQNVFENDKGEEQEIEVVRYEIEGGLRYLALPDDDSIDIDDEESIERFIAAEIRASFIVEFIMRKPLSIEVIREFGKKNAPSYVYPYWCEYCQSTCNRMMLPSTVLPILKSD